MHLKKIWMILKRKYQKRNYYQNRKIDNFKTQRDILKKINNKLMKSIKENDSRSHKSNTPQIMLTLKLLNLINQGLDWLTQENKSLLKTNLKPLQGNNTILRNNFIQKIKDYYFTNWIELKSSEKQPNESKC